MQITRMVTIAPLCQEGVWKYYEYLRLGRLTKEEKRGEISVEQKADGKTFRSTLRSSRKQTQLVALMITLLFIDPTLNLIDF